MRNGIDRDNMAREVDELTNEKLITMTRQEACDLMDELSDGTVDDLVTAFDWAQGDSMKAGRYVVIYIEP